MDNRASGRSKVANHLAQQLTSIDLNQVALKLKAAGEVDQEQDRFSENKERHIPDSIDFDSLQSQPEVQMSMEPQRDDLEQALMNLQVLQGSSIAAQNHQQQQISYSSSRNQGRRVAADPIETTGHDEEQRKFGNLAKGKFVYQPKHAVDHLEMSEITEQSSQLSSEYGEPSVSEAGSAFHAGLAPRLEQ